MLARASKVEQHPKRGRRRSPPERLRKQGINVACRPDERQAVHDAADAYQMTAAGLARAIWEYVLSQPKLLEAAVRRHKEKRGVRSN